MRNLAYITIILTLMLGVLSVASGCSPSDWTTASGASLARFQSADQFINAFLNRQRGFQYMDDKAMLSSNSVSATAGESSSTEPQHSTTNVQVEGVDEADVVKTDGDFIYVISGDSVFIIAAYPAEKMRIVSTIQFNDHVSLSEMFVNRDRLVLIGSGYPAGNRDLQEPNGYPIQQVTFVKIYDISDRNTPKLLKSIEYEGSYDTSRMIEDNVHIVLTSYPGYVIYNKDDIQPSDIIPLYRATVGEDEPGTFKPVCDWSEVECVDPENCSSFLSIVSMSLKDNNDSIDKRVIAGNSDNVYASSENLYVSNTDYEYYPYSEKNEIGDTTHTTIYKFKLNGNTVEYLASAEVPGTVLNQFSMDESNGYFRIATTIGHVTREGSGSTNNVYILDPALDITGRLEGLAKGETIYSARFMGNRAYLVTFKKVDPFFVLDLSDPANPQVLGALKIPGYSDYLHPYDETHIIGVGKNTVEADPGQGNFAWYQGMKIALFDVSDFSNPREMYKVEIGDRGTSSFALDNHKAFLFDRDKNLLVLPILLAELTPEQKASSDTRANEYGEFTYQGAYVYDISLNSGINLKGRITHSDNPREFSNYRYYYSSNDFVERSLYIENSLYTISQVRIKANNLDNLEEQASVELH
jgi:inhibitor of cysteine peptidase